MDLAMSDEHYLPENLRKQESAGGAEGHTGAYRAYAEGGDRSLIQSHAVVEDSLAEAYARLARGVCRDLGHELGPDMLDAGCAVGTITDAFRRLGFRACGLDLSVKAIEAARRERPACEFLAESIDDEKVLTGRLFDVVHAREFYPFTRVSDPEVHARLLAGFARRLKPGGAAVVSQLVEPGKGLELTLPGLESRMAELGFARHLTAPLAPLKLVALIGPLIANSSARWAAQALGYLLRPVSGSARHRLHLFVKP